MKGLLIFPLNKSNPEFIGLQAKMDAQVKAFLENGEMDLFNFDESGVFFNNELIYTFKPDHLNYLLGAYRTFYRVILQHITTDEYDFIFVRYPLATPFFNFFLRSLKKRGFIRSIFVEIPTYPYRFEAKTLLRKILMLSDILLFSTVSAKITKFITHYKIPERRKLKSYFMGNGVIYQKPIVHKATGEFVITGIANLSDYHGYDRIIRGVADYYSNFSGDGPTLRVKIAGDGPDRLNLELLTEELGVGKYVEFLNVVRGDQLDELLEITDVGLSPLALHRKGLSTDGSLKSREYCMRGIPYVTCAEDEDLPTNFPGRHIVIMNDDPIELISIISFVRQLPQNVGLQMHNYAKEHLTWSSKIRKFIQYELNAS